MLIQEAIKSGKPFRRPPSMEFVGWWLQAKIEDGKWIHADNEGDSSIEIYDILADDWEIKE